MNASALELALTYEHNRIRELAAPANDVAAVSPAGRHETDWCYAIASQHLAAAEDVFRTLATEPLADRLHNPGLEPARADVIVGGCCVLVAIFRRLGFEELIVSESDILDGLVLSLDPT